MICVPLLDEERHGPIQQLDRLISDSGVYPGTERFSVILNQIGWQIESHFVNWEKLFESFAMTEGALAFGGITALMPRFLSQTRNASESQPVSARGAWAVEPTMSEWLG